MNTNKHIISFMKYLLNTFFCLSVVVENVEVKNIKKLTKKKKNYCPSYIKHTRHCPYHAFIQSLLN